MSSITVNESISTPRPEQYAAEIFDGSARELDTRREDDEPCEDNQLTSSHSMSINPLTTSENHADNLSPVASPKSHPPWMSASPFPVSVVRETPPLPTVNDIPLPSSAGVFMVGQALPFNRAHEIPLPPSSASSIVKQVSLLDGAHDVPLPPSTARSMVEQVPLLDEIHDPPLPPLPTGSVDVQTSPFDEAHKIPLPPSTASSVVGDTSQFDTAHGDPPPPSERIPTFGPAFQSNTAREIPLSPSVAETLSHTDSHNFPNHPDPMSGDPYGDYRFHDIRDIWRGYRWEAQYLQDRIEQISEWLPHLAVLFRGFGTKSAASARVRSYQISAFGTASILQMLDMFEAATHMTWNEVQDRLSMVPLQFGTERIVLVEDLNPALITGLYATFGIGPEILAEHLNRSAYGSSTYTDPDPSTWSFRSSKNYVSIKWYRPVYTAELVDMPPHARREFRNRGKAEWEEAIILKPEDENENPRKETVVHTLTRCANIFRQERPLSSVVSDTWQATDKRALTTIEERVTLYTEQRQGQRIAVALVDPLPYINHSRKTKLGNRVIKKERILPFPVHPRSPPPVSSVNELLQTHNFGRSQTFFNTHTSMSEDLQAWMTEYSRHGLPAESNRLFVAILEIVSRDTRTTLSLLTAALGEITLGSMDDSQEQERLASWQTLIRSYQADLPAMRDSLHEFMRWCFRDNPPPYVHKKVRDLTIQTDDLIERVEKAHKALRAELSILESKRGIAEAEGVAKLTELAFIFIPLTFSASLFSMQVRELEENMPTLGGFVGVCFLFLFLSYGVRLATRSRAIIDRKRELFRSIRRDSALESKDVPTHVFISWTFNKLFERLFPEGKEAGRWTFAIIFTSAVLAPILALIWTKTRIDNGIKAILTIVMIFLAFVVLYALQKRFKVFLTKALNHRGFLYWFERRRQRDEAQTPGEIV